MLSSSISGYWFITLNNELVFLDSEPPITSIYDQFGLCFALLSPVASSELTISYFNF